MEEEGDDNMAEWVRQAVLGILAAAALTLLLTWSSSITVRESSSPEGGGETAEIDLREGLEGEAGEERAEREVPVAALTFDDAPHAVWTPILLDGLKERGVKATFFLMGQNIPGNEEIVERMAREGHLVGNHSYRHEPLTQAGLEQVCDSFARTGEMIWEITGIRPEYARPPYGDWNEELECRTELSTVLWDVDSLDWNYQDRKQIADKVCREIENGDIVLMHDIFQSSQEAALDIIDRLTAEGWQFVTADELMVD